MIRLLTGLRGNRILANRIDEPRTARAPWRHAIIQKAFFAGLYTGITLAACLFLGCLWFKDALCR